MAFNLDDFVKQVKQLEVENTTLKKEKEELAKQLAVSNDKSVVIKGKYDTLMKILTSISEASTKAVKTLSEDKPKV